MADASNPGVAHPGDAPIAQAMEEARVVPTQAQAPATGTSPGAQFDNGLGTGGPLVGGPGRAGYQPPVGKWKDGLFDCFSQISPVCLTSWFLPCAALAMLTKRVGLQSYQFTFSMTLGFWVAGLIILIIGDMTVSPLIFGLGRIVINIFTILCLVWTFKLYQRVRAKYQLPGPCYGQRPMQNANGQQQQQQQEGLGEDCCGDCMTAWCCGPCAIAQMMRHTMDYRDGCEGCAITSSAVETLV